MPLQLAYAQRTSLQKPRMHVEAAHDLRSTVLQAAPKPSEQRPLSIPPGHEDAEEVQGLDGGIQGNASNLAWTYRVKTLPNLQCTSKP